MYGTYACVPKFADEQGPDGKWCTGRGWNIWNNNSVDIQIGIRIAATFNPIMTYFLNHSDTLSMQKNCNGTLIPYTEITSFCCMAQHSRLLEYLIDREEPSSTLDRPML
ncbi:hypothetical protein CISG_00454 [Coccidioides immitis RMSCC 3703]|uniref:Uncharacterized protein n=2 Tax=Coccidioides immitis TaxID=5501 RepID=A0A0J8QI82_COCIT|nr:hypothetical protein CIRG_07084 [Coccidioides immitis RMSCC 2394]KMU72145.1 hypothetical protein CISG_00454 [Coccidioides immitis RMSCC 3703]